MSRSIKKGPFVQEALYKKVVACLLYTSDAADEGYERSRRKESSQNLEQNLNYFS